VPKGGVARRVTIINSVCESSAGPVLVLDAGGTLFGQSLAAASKGQVIVEAMNAMAYDALTVGELDLEQGLDVLRQRAKEARFPLLSCNLVAAQDGKPIFGPYTVVERNGIRVGILGVSEPELGSMWQLAKVARVLDPLSSVHQYLPEVRAQSDIVIVLSHLGFEVDTTLAQLEPGIQIIVGGKSRQVLSAPEIVGNTVIVQAGFDGEWLGRLDVAFDGQGQAVEPRVEIITLGPEVASEPAMAALVDSYKQRFPTSTPGD
jgi:2',3'-cyclic-nucleotide 2'-phosphodiesterase (5'-nucleotidase family)